MTFPKNFLWGAAASSYQIEGAATQDGRGQSVWDVFCRTPGRIWQGHTGDVACDHYNRYKEDVGLMKQMGLQAYRFSIAWPRVLPEGVGRVNEAGIGFYDKLVDELLAAGIAPYATLFHWDYPYDLQLKGGWTHPDSPRWFADYTRVIIDRLSDRVTDWMTLNEPQVFLQFGLGDGKNAPGMQLPMKEQLLALHNSLLAHGLSVQTIRAHAKKPARVGWAPVCVTRMPADPKNPSDVKAAYAAMAGFEKKNLWNNTWYNDPIILGHYPEEGLAFYGADVPKAKAGDFETMKQPIDFIGINIYEGQPVTMGDDGKPRHVERQVGYATTAFRWPVEPESLYWGPRFMNERYGLPIYITENGLSNQDWVALDGKVHDPQRIDFTTRYLRALNRAANDGVDIRGYFHWSLMDNFEWAEGYKERFGLIFVDFPTQKRILKDSAHWYRTVIESNGAVLNG